MVQQQPNQDYPEPLTGRARVDYRLAAMLICALAMAIVLGIAGWNGRGGVANWPGPGIVGLLVGVLTGFSVSVLAFGLPYWLRWASFNRTMANLVVVAFLALILFPAWLASGWSGVLSRLVRFIPMLVVLALIGWWIHSAMKRYPPGTGEPTLPTPRGTP
jgi:hypothetical protein